MVVVSNLILNPKTTNDKQITLNPNTTNDTN